MKCFSIKTGECLSELYRQIVVPGLMYGIGGKRPWCLWSHVWSRQKETMVL